jgi:hypothetical protein
MTASSLWRAFLWTMRIGAAIDLLTFGHEFGQMVFGKKVRDV